MFYRIVIFKVKESFQKAVKNFKEEHGPSEALYSPKNCPLKNLTNSLLLADPGIY